ncbi:hypothetical protein KC333_g470 [Hortaea werneckii]|nr:hypothetical protein KC333_g470 [Hortaea werneckii]KAI7326000.1 hypothetical protein KC326_g547 [Hortaea werneckii]
MDASPLAKLPPELRNRVYHEVLRQEDPIILLFNEWDEQREIPEVRLKLPPIARSSSGDGDVDYWDDHISGVYDQEDASRHEVAEEELGCMRNMMALTATCKPLRQETRDLFFAINSFRIEVTYWDGEHPNFSKDTASDPIESFLEHLSTRSAISAVKSITLDLGFVYVWPEKSYPLYDMVTGLNQGFLKRHTGLPLQVKAMCCLYAFYPEEMVHVYIDMQNLAASIKLALERLEKWHQEELEYRDDSAERETCQAEFDDITDQLEACLQQIAATEEV